MKNIKNFLFLGILLFAFSCQKDTSITEVATADINQEITLEWGGLNYIQSPISNNDFAIMATTATTRDGSSTNTLVFDEVPRQSVDGLTVEGVSFEFEINGNPSSGANYNSSGPGPSSYWNCPCLEGPSEGKLTISFDSPTRLVEFGVARSIFSTLTPGFSVILMDNSGATIDVIDVNTSPVTPSPFTGALFSYLSTGESVKSLEITFSTPSTRFALDNLVFEIDQDGDGCPDSDDPHPNSNVDATVIIDGCDSGVPNIFPEDCSTMSDLIADCAAAASTHGEFVSCLSALTNSWKDQDLITGQQKGAIQSCGAQSNLP